MLLPNFLQKNTSSIVLCFVVVLNFLFGLEHLEQFITADEHYWVYERIPEYWDAFAEGKLKNTFINDKPGISLALVSGIGYALHPDSPALCFENISKLLVCDTDRIGGVYRDFRLPILLVNGLLLFLFYYLFTRLTNRFVALWSTTFIALSPTLLGISQIINPDSLLWSFGAIALFSYVVLLESNEKKFLWLTLLFTGLALLSKYTALILLPFYFSLILFRFVWTNKHSEETLHANIKKDLFQWGVILFGSLIVLCTFFPALLLSPSARAAFVLAVPDEPILFLIGGVFCIWLLIDTYLRHNTHLFCIRAFCQKFLLPLSSAIPVFFLGLFTSLILARNFFSEWHLFALIPFDIKDISDARYLTDIPNFFESFLLEWNPVLFSLPPLALIGLTGLFIASLKTRHQEYSFLTNSLLFFTLLFTILLIFSNILSTPRYSILLYPLFLFLAGVGIWYVVEKFSYPYTKSIVTAIIVVGSCISLVVISPFYFNYTNALLPKSELINDAWGYGGYEAAMYLNSLPNAENLTVWADYYGVCEFFIGKCLTAYTFDREIVRTDYYVLTRRGQIRYMDRYLRWEEKSGLTAYQYYDVENPDWQLIIDNRPENFIKVVKVEN